MKRTFKGFMNRGIFNTALLALVLSMTAMDSPGYVQYVIAFISCAVVLLYMIANKWI